MLSAVDAIPNDLSSHTGTLVFESWVATISEASVSS